MATSDQIAELRLFTAEADDSNYTDEQLAAIIDAATSIKSAAETVWLQKAARYASLVNVSESGSSRSLSDLQKNALSMAKQMASDADEDQDAQTGIRIRRLTRR
jgi:Cdc6-like AAA superfamily ATPase